MEMISVYLILVLALLVMSIKIVPQQQAWVIERLGKFHQTLKPGLTFIIPLIDKVAYKHSLKERAIDVHEQMAITQDNVTLIIDGVIYLKITNPTDASYGVENPYFSVVQLAQTSMRSAIGKIHLDKTFEERETLNAQIVAVINEAAGNWGIQCLRYEIKDIKPPANVVKAMEMQVAAERQRRADILESEGKKQARINLAEAGKQEVVLASEGSIIDQTNRSQGEAQAIQTIAIATAQGILEVAKAIGEKGSKEAMMLKVAEQYIAAFHSLAQEANTIIVPANTNDVSSMITQALTIFNNLGEINKRPPASQS